jgi:hypothetical protein
MFLFWDQWLRLNELWSVLRWKCSGCAKLLLGARLQLLPQLALLRVSRLRDRNPKQSSRLARRRLSTTCWTRWLARTKGLKIFMLLRGMSRTKNRSRGARPGVSLASRTSISRLRLSPRTANIKTLPEGVSSQDSARPDNLAASSRPRPLEPIAISFGLEWGRASLSIHGPDRTAELIHYAIGDSAPTLQVGPQLARAPPGRGN